MTVAEYLNLDRDDRNHVAGAFVDGAGGGIGVTDPATGEILPRVPEPDTAEVDR